MTIEQAAAIKLGSVVEVRRSAQNGGNFLGFVSGPLEIRERRGGGKVQTLEVRNKGGSFFRVPVGMIHATDIVQPRFYLAEARSAIEILDSGELRELMAVAAKQIMSEAGIALADICTALQEDVEAMQEGVCEPQHTN